MADGVADWMDTPAARMLVTTCSPAQIEALKDLTATAYAEGIKEGTVLAFAFLSRTLGGAIPEMEGLMDVLIAESRATVVESSDWAPGKEPS